MQREKDDDKRGFCRWFFRLVVVKLMAGHRAEKSSVTKKLIKKESKSDITIYFKQSEDSEDNANPINISSSEKEKVIMLVNGSNGSKQSIASEPSFRGVGAGRSQPQPLLNDINKKSHAFIESRLEKMRKGL